MKTSEDIGRTQERETRRKSYSASFASRVLLACLAFFPVSPVFSQPAAVLADPTTGALFRPSAEIFASANNLGGISGLTASLTVTGGVKLLGYDGDADPHFFLGPNAGKAGLTGDGNVGVGVNVFSNLYATSSWNTALGDGSLQNAGSSSVAVFWNTALGSGALPTLATGDSNTAVGADTMYAKTSGDANTAGGHFALYSNLAGSNNTVWGTRGFTDNASGSNNTGVGFSVFDKNVSGSGNVGLGSYAGYWETGSNKFYVTNTDHGSEALGRTSALLYGLFDATPANQFLRINGNLEVPIGNVTTGGYITVNNSLVTIGGGTATPLLFSGAGTGYQYQQFTTTGGNYFFGISNSAGAGLLSGAGNYSMALLTESARNLAFGTNNTLRLLLDGTTGAATFSGTVIPQSGTSVTTATAGEFAFDTNAWASGRGAMQLYDGTANTYVVAALASDTPSNGQVPTYNTGGTITWETPSGNTYTNGAGLDLTTGTFSVAAAQTTISSVTAPTNTALALATLDNNKDINLTPHGTGRVKLNGSILMGDLSYGLVLMECGAGLGINRRDASTTVPVVKLGFDNNGPVITIASGGVIGFSANSVTVDSGVQDASFSRLGAASVALGNGTAGDFSGDLKLRNLTPTGGNGLAVFTVATLPATAGTGLFQGSCVLVTDSNTSTFNATVAGGGSTVIGARYDGTNWKVF